MTVKDRIHQLVDELPEEVAPSVESYLQALRSRVAPPKGARTRTLEERHAAIKAARGSIAHLPGSVDEFLRQKDEDRQRELERDARRQAEHG